MTLRLRVVLLTLAILLPAIAVGAWAVAMNVARERVGIENRVREMTRALSLVVDRELERRAAIVQLLAASPEVQDLNIEGFCRLARASLTEIKGPIALLDRERQYANTAIPGCVLPSDRQHVDAVAFATRGLVLSDLYVGAVSHSALITLSAPVTIQGHLYNVALAIRPEELQQLIVDLKLPSNWAAAVVNREGRIVAHLPNPSRWIGSFGDGIAYPLMRRTHEGDYVGTNLEGKPARLFFSTSSRFGMSFLIALPSSEFDRNGIRSVLEGGVGAVLLLLLGGCVAVWIGRRVARPIEGLQAAAVALEAGHTVSVPRTGIEEVDQVGVALSRASERIRSSNLAMERRVAQAVAEVESAQARLLQSQKLEVIGRLTGGIAHDFNNLLQTLSTGLHVLSQTVDDVRAKPLIDAGLRAVSRAARLVQQLLSFGRHHAIKRQPVDLRNLLLMLEPLLARALPGNIVLHTDLAPDLWPLDTDPAQLELALLNLIFNARDATRGGGVITLRARNLPAAEVGQVEIAVSDTGTGIAPDTLPLIFEPFFTTKPVGRGAGLGLAQVRSFAQDSGGSVSAESAQGQGATLTLLLPRSLRPAVPEDSPAEPPQLGHPCTLLFVEDDVLVAEVVGSALTGAGFRVLYARTADEALAMLRRQTQVDILFTDVVMPGSMDGMQLAQLVKAEFPSVPVVVASGYAGRESAEPDVQLLSKPYSIQALIRMLVEALPAHVRSRE